jgi:hypothetical protein
MKLQVDNCVPSLFSGVKNTANALIYSPESDTINTMTKKYNGKRSHTYGTEKIG